MTTSRILKSCLLGAALLALCLPAALLAASPADVKSQIRSRIPSAIEEALKDLKGIKIGSARCQADFDRAVAAARAEAAACLNTDNPPAGSPIDKFNKFSQFQHDQFCGNLNAGQCADKVLNDQKKFCAIERAKDLSKAKTESARCEAKIKICDNARAEVGNTNKEIVRLEKELARLKSSLPGLQQKVSQVCIGIP